MELQALAGMIAASIDRTPAFLDPLLGGAVEGNDVLGRTAHVGDDEADARIKLGTGRLVADNRPSSRSSAFR
jgi:hypothetical protein